MKMVGQLIQKKWLAYRKYTLYEDKILVESKSARTIDRYEVPIEQLGVDTYYRAENVIAGKIMLFVFIAIFICIWIAFLFGKGSFKTGQFILLNIMYVGLACFAYFKPHDDDVYLVGGKRNLVFYRDIPDEAEVLRFIDLINSTRNERLKDTLTCFDENTNDIEYKNRLAWLKTQKIINANEYENYLEAFRLARLL